ncbi:MAG TPA: YopX family protein [Candidatus Eisenbacteria bacterium]|nr:YopX family protein [Candidatus Eisenbacteria bacterium]
MKEIRFRAWHLKEKKMYFRAYQKWFHVLLCEDDKGRNAGLGLPARRAFYGDCVLLESTGLFDRRNAEIFEGDFVRVTHAGGSFEDLVGPPPDTFGVKRHPLEEILKKHGVDGAARLEIEVIGNEYEAEAPAPKEAAS